MTGVTTRMTNIFYFFLTAKTIDTKITLFPTLIDAIKMHYKYFNFMVSKIYIKIPHVQNFV